MTRLTILLILIVAMLGCTAAEPHTDTHDEMPAAGNMTDHMEDMSSDHMEDMSSDHMKICHLTTEDMGDHMEEMSEHMEDMTDHMEEMSEHTDSSDDHDDGHGGHGGEGHNSAEPIPGAAEIRVIATEFGFEPATLNLVAGEPVNIVLVNEGLLPHELGIKELELHAHAEAGETVTVGFTPDETGEFEFGCYIAGHYEAGMFGEATIEEN
jgi:heme/copper-type cytochrome/quinol oxidase subunit 2